SELFAAYGEEEFRALETRVIKRLLRGGPRVISTGGGAFINEKTRKQIERGGISLWLKANRRPKWFPPVRAYSIAATLLGALTLLLDPGLITWAPWFVVPLGVGLWAASRRRDRDLLAGIATVGGACMMTVVAYAAGFGSAPERAWLLALVQLLYFAGTVFYVKSVIRERGNRTFLWISMGYHVAAAVVAAVLAWPLGLVFGLLAVRSALIPRLGWSPKQVGLLEIPATVLVSVLSLLLL
ncbi:MAG TPA: YwiC-like family protein, partial [Marmoricola sp.]|nr:YwiC-like family protein [Marmoricola sp.]